jgi:hypothetical protein
VHGLTYEALSIFLILIPGVRLTERNKNS